MVEAYNTEHIVGGPHEVAMAQRDDGAEHEVSMVQLDRGMTLKEALLNSQSKIVERPAALDLHWLGTKSSLVRWIQHATAPVLGALGCPTICSTSRVRLQRSNP